MTPAVSTLLARPAQPSDVAAIAALLTRGLAADPVAEWLVPDPAERQAVFQGLLAMEVDHAVEWGDVDVLPDMSGVAVWRRHPADDAPVLSDHHLGAFTRGGMPRFRQLSALLNSYRSDAPHHWLAWLYVEHDCRGQGVGTELLARHHQVVDQRGLPVDVVVTSERARDFLTFHGYIAGLPLHLPSGPRLWPLRRPGHPAARSDQAGRNGVPSAVAEVVSTSEPTFTTTSVERVTMLREASDLRTNLIDQLCAEDTIRTSAVEVAMRRTPRHLFLPGVPMQQAYADEPVYTKTDTCGTSISAASQPRIVAMMLEQLDVRSGQRVMEAGAGTGYNAALLAAVVGDSGRVVTIDVDEDLVNGARKSLAAAGVANVDVVHGDGALGYSEGAPYDRIIATVGAYETPAAWLKQLAPDGRLVVPLRLRGAASRSIIFERYDGGWRDQGSELAVFMPLRGIGDDARRLVSLTPELDVILQVHKDQEVEAAALADVLETERRKVWTDVFFPPMVPYEWMDLWLACRLDNAIMRMSVQPTAVQRGAVTPMFSWGAMATTRGADLAYLTTRPALARPDGSRLYEVGVIGHGPNGRDLAHHVSEEIRSWYTNYRSREVRFEIPDAPIGADPAVGRFVLARPHHPITVTWE